MFWSISLINQSFISCMIALVVTICIERLIKCTLCSLSAVIQCYLWNLELHFFGLTKCFYASGFLLAQKTNLFFWGGGQFSPQGKISCCYSPHTALCLMYQQWSAQFERGRTTNCDAPNVNACMCKSVCLCVSVFVVVQVSQSVTIHHDYLTCLSFDGGLQE